MRVAIAGFHHETNTFSHKATTYEDFVSKDDWPAMCKGDKLVAVMEELSNIPPAGFLHVAKQHNWHIEPILWCHAQPSGKVEKQAYEDIVRDIIFGLQSAKDRIDAIYLDLHGAMVAQHVDDGEGELLHRIRRIMGINIPIILSLDFHANITREMFKLADVMVGYHTYPHVDKYETGERAAHALHAIMQRGQAPYKAMKKLPFLVPISSQCTFTDPAQTLYEEIKKKSNEKSTLEASILMGFPPSDIMECGPAIVTYAWEQEDANQVCESVEKHMLGLEEDFISKLWKPDEAILYVNASRSRGTFIFADTQDNPGAGATSDTVEILHALLRHRLKNAIIACHYDPENAALAKRCGQGKELLMTLGGSVPGDTALEKVFKVEKISDQPFYAKSAYYKGTHVDLGVMALVQCEGVRILLVSKRVQPFDRALFEHMGVDLEEQKIIVLKSSVHFRADFEKIAEEILAVESPGINIDNPEQLPYENIRKGIRLSPKGKLSL